MHRLGYAVVALSALLSWGGVTLRSSADRSEEMSMLSDDSSEPQLGRCQLPEPTHRHLSLSLPERGEGAFTFTLDSQGYNYSRPGEHRPQAPLPAAPAK